MSSAGSDGFQWLTGAPLSLLSPAAGLRFHRDRHAHVTSPYLLALSEMKRTYYSELLSEATPTETGEI